MDRLSVRAAARHLNIAEKTVRRWMQSGKLTATRDARGQYQIERSDLEAMSIQVSIPASTRNATDDIQERLDRIEHRLNALEAQRQHMTPAQPQSLFADHPVSELPGELVPFTDFFKQHGISETTARRGIGKAFPVAPGGPWSIGGNLVKIMLASAGRRAFYEAYHNHTGFTLCDQCPHAE